MMTKAQETRKANPFDADSVEWQLYEQWRAAMALIVAADDDEKRAQVRRSEAIDRRDKYRDALEKLGASKDLFASK